MVANLWSVTDKDIDRFTMALAESFTFGGDGKCMDVLRVVAQSRNVCKLRKLVGAAPVCYGVPWSV